MKNELFRKEAVERIASPEELNTYVKVLSPRVWLILLGVALAAFGLVIFAVSTDFPVWDLFFGGSQTF
jgi:hypothetical protein